MLDFNPQKMFGNYKPTNDAGAGPFDGNRQPGQGGHGAYGLPNAFEGWDAAARFAFAPGQRYASQLQPSLDYFNGEMGKDYGKQLFGMSSDIAERQFKNAKTQFAQSSQRSGTGGGAAVSPFMEYQLQNEAQARAGAFGDAARASVLQAEQMRTNAARGYQDTLANQYQAFMAPAYLQSARNANVPVGGQGPSLLGPALNAAGGFASALPAFMG